MKEVKYRCESCGYAEVPTKKEQIIKGIFKVITTILVMIGIVTLIFLIYGGPLTVMESVSSTFMIKVATQDFEYDHDALRHYGINTTRTKCHDRISCYAFNVYKNLSNTPYIPASLISPLQRPDETLEYGGDCKNTAILYTSMMKSLGVKSNMVCKLSKEHCISVVPYNEKNYFVVDLTIPGFYVMNTTDDKWSYLENGLRAD